MKKFKIPLLLAFMILIADAFSKFWIQLHLPLMSSYTQYYPYGGLGIFKSFFGIEFSIIHTTNRGAAWGVLADWQQLLVYGRILLILGILCYLMFFNKRPWYNIPLVLIVAGATGNVLDFFIYGHVIDMFHFIFWGYDYPVFNIADSAIFMGIALLFVLSLQEKTVYTRS